MNSFPYRAMTALRLLLGLAAFVTTSQAAVNDYPLAHASAPPDNPLKGFIAYAGTYTTFPYSMEWNYLPLRSLMTGPNTFNWTSLDQLLNNVASRGHQTAFRIYLDYPTKPTGIPQYLLDAGLATHNYNDYGNNGISVSPITKTRCSECLRHRTINILLIQPPLTRPC